VKILYTFVAFKNIIEHDLFLEFMKDFFLQISKYYIDTRLNLISLTPIKNGHAVAKLFKALRYKPGGCGFDSRQCL
jgi:hypothetical protein